MNTLPCLVLSQGKCSVVTFLEFWSSFVNDVSCMMPVIMVIQGTCSILNDELEKLD